MAMHPELCKRLVFLQLEEAIDEYGLFSERVQLEEVSFPTFFVRFTNKYRDIRLIRFECNGYDTLPIAIEPIHPISRESLPPEEWMFWNGNPFPAHPLLDNKPFLCIEGTRYYYTHPQHLPTITGQYWEALRPSLSVASLIREIGVNFRRGEWW